MLLLRRWGWLFLLMIFTFSALITSNIDDGSVHDKLKYLSIAWWMYQSGHYLVPMVNGIPYTDKPPLLFWMMAGAWHLFGVNMFAIQMIVNAFIVSWCFLLRGCYATLFPKDILGKDLVPYVLMGSFAIWRDLWFLRADLLLILGVLLFNFGILKILNDKLSNAASKLKGRTPILGAAYHPWSRHPSTLTQHYSIYPAKILFFLQTGLPGLYIALGSFLGLFGKGPVVYVFTLLPFFVSAIFTKAYRPLLLKIIMATSVGTCFFLAMWAIPAMLHMGHDFTEQLLYKQITHRAGADYAPHSNKSIFIYLYNYLPLLFLPWIINLVFFKKMKNIFWKETVYRSFIAAMFIVPLLIFSFFGQKDLRYILPTAVFGMLFFTRFFVEYKDYVSIIRLNKFFLGICFALMSVVCLSLYFIPSAHNIIFKNSIGHILPPSVFVLILAGVNFLVMSYMFFSKRDLLHIVFIFSSMFFLTYGALKIYFISLEKSYTHIDQVGQLLREQALHKKGIALYQASNYHGEFTYAARLTDIIPALETSQQLKQWLQHNPQGVVISYEKNCALEGMHQIAFYFENQNAKPCFICQH